MPFRTRLNRFVLAFGTAALAGPMLAQPVLAAATCANTTDMVAFRTAAVQQQLMVAALTCHDIDAYNRFVLAYQPELQKSDNDLKAYFVRRGSEAAYDTFKTKLANLSSLSDIANGPAYCENAAAAFDMALKSHQGLASFVADQRLMIALPQQTVCAESRSMAVVEAAASKAPPVKLAEAKPAPVKVQMAAATPPRALPVENVPGVPAYDMPASPYGDEAPPPPRSYRQDRDDAQMAPPAPDYYQQERDDAEMAPPPPRPERPRLQQASRDEDFYAAVYANQARRRYRWAPPPPPPDDYYYYER